MTLTDEQGKAITDAKVWFKSEETKPFVILGCAGSGKTTVVKYLIKELNIEDKVVKYCTFTGKAASVLIKKGNPATTIHKLIYDPIINEKDEIVGFVKKDTIGMVDLIIVDEFYMVSNEIMTDLLSYGKKIICLGDNYQLPPPFGEVNKLYQHPDVTLTQVMRQSLDNPILYLANKAKNHEFIKTGKYGEEVEVVTKNNLDLEKLKTYDQIIAGKNDTVKKFNTFYRKQFLNITPDNYLPTLHEKIICLRNNWNLFANEDGVTTNMVNGLTLTVESVIAQNGLEIGNVNLKPEFYNESKFLNVKMDLLMFKYNYNKVEDLFDNKGNYADIIKNRQILFRDKDINKFTYGYTITTHKSQGSEWDNVYFIFEPFKGYRDPLYWQMLYTGITRAAKKLIIAI